MPVNDGLTNRLVRLESSVSRVFKKAMDWAEEDFRREIESKKWDWPNETKGAIKHQWALRGILLIWRD